MSRPVLRAALYGLTLALVIAAVGTQLPGLLLPRPALLSDLGLGPAGRSLVLPALRGDGEPPITAAAAAPRASVTPDRAPALTLPLPRRADRSSEAAPRRGRAERRRTSSTPRPRPTRRAGRGAAAPVADLTPSPVAVPPASHAPAGGAATPSASAPTTTAPRRMALRVARMALNRDTGARATPRLDLRLALEDASGVAARTMDLSLDVTGLADDAAELADAPVALHGRIEVVNAAAVVAGAAVDPQLRIRLQVEADAGEARAEVAAGDEGTPEVLSNAVEVSLPFDPEELAEPTEPCPDEAPTPDPEPAPSETLEVLLPIGAAAPVAEQVADVPATAAASEPVSSPDEQPEAAAVTVAVRLEVVPEGEAAADAVLAAEPAPASAP